MTTPNGRIAAKRVSIVHITANVDIPRQSAVFSTNKIPLVVLGRSPTPLLVLTAAPLGPLQEWRLRPPTIIPTAAETGGFSFVAAGTHSAAPACSNVGPVPPESRPDISSAPLMDPP